MGLFERCQILIDEKVLKAAVFERLYGYRVEVLVVPTVIRDHVNEGARGWSDFIALAWSLRELKEQRLVGPVPSRMALPPLTVSPA